jgi:hypothetical protein
LSDVYGESAGHIVPDVQWIEDCGKLGWVAVTKNPKIGHTPVEIDAIVEHRTRVFSIAKADLTREENGLILGRHLLRMIRRSGRRDGCFWRLYLGEPKKDLP